jgi:hypothetical protein
MMAVRRFASECATEGNVTGRIVRIVMTRPWWNSRSARRRSIMGVKGTVRATTVRAWIQVPDLKAEDALLRAKAAKGAARVAMAALRVKAGAVTGEVRVDAINRPLVPRRFAGIGRQEIASMASLVGTHTRTKCGPTPRGTRRRKTVGANPVAGEERVRADAQRTRAPVETLVKPVVMSGALLLPSVRKALRAAGEPLRRRTPSGLPTSEIRREIGGLIGHAMRSGQKRQRPSGLLPFL